MMLNLALCGMLAVGVALPQVRTLSGYTYDMVGTAATLGYGLAVALAALALFDENLPADIARKLHWVGAAGLLGMAVWSGYLVTEGLQWFSYQIAIDMSTWSTVDTDAYWALLYQLAGLSPGSSVFNDLRTAHAQYGPGVTINNATVFYNTINQLSHDQVRQLVSLSGGGSTALPLGSALIASVAAVKVWMLVRQTRQQAAAAEASTSGLASTTG